MIDIRKLKELVRLMVENDLAELDLKDQQETVSIKRGREGVPVVQSVAAPVPVAAPATNGAPAPAAPPAADAPAADHGDLVAIESPMVGTFYASPDPESPLFVEVGKAVNASTTVCLIEAMKVFNEIKAETTGTVEQVCVENGAAVEFGQTLFLVRPN